MEWKDYKPVVDTCRKVIVFPFFHRSLAGKSGVGIDIGCGDGDLTQAVAGAVAGSVLGVDRSKDEISRARALYGDKVRFIAGDISKNILHSTGLQFDFVFSNCCFCHLSDELIHEVLLDAFCTMRPEAELVFLVPHISWAEEMYADIGPVYSGITATPRFGGRQYFRPGYWYRSALERCGFEQISEADICIPEDERLDDRYLANVGRPIFLAITAKRSRTLPNSDLMRKAFDVAHDNRKLEIQLFWQRSLFFWGFVAAALVAYGTAYHAKSDLALVFALFGLVCSVVWSAGNRGSKYWQEYWEEKVNYFQHFATGNIFFDRNPKTPHILDNFAARRISVSKLVMALSDYVVILWLILCFHSVVLRYYQVGAGYYRVGGAILLVATLVYCLAILRGSKSED